MSDEGSGDVRRPHRAEALVTFEGFEGPERHEDVLVYPKGLLLRTRDLRPVGTPVDFDVQIDGESAPVRGRGLVVFSRWQDQGPRRPAGLGLRVEWVDDDGREVLERLFSAPTQFELTPSPSVSETVTASGFGTAGSAGSRTDTTRPPRAVWTPPAAPAPASASDSTPESEEVNLLPLEDTDPYDASTRRLPVGGIASANVGTDPGVRAWSAGGWTAPSPPASLNADQDLSADSSMSRPEEVLDDPRLQGAAAVSRRWLEDRPATGPLARIDVADDGVWRGSTPAGVDAPVAMPSASAAASRPLPLPERRAWEDDAVAAGPLADSARVPDSEAWSGSLEGPALATVTRQSPGPRLFPWILAGLLVALLAAGGYWAWERYSPWRAGASVEEVVAAPAPPPLAARGPTDTTLAEDIASIATPGEPGAATGAGTGAGPEDATVEDPAAAPGTSPEQSAGTSPGSTSPGTSPGAAPAPAAPVVPVVEQSPGTSAVPSAVGRFGAVRDIRWTRSSAGLTVRVTTDGQVPAAALQRSRLTAPAREVLRLRAPVEPFNRPSLAVGDPLVTRIRTGIQPGGDLQIVLDLSSEGVRAGAVRFLDDGFELTFAPTSN